MPDDEEDFVFQRKSKAEQVGDEAVAVKKKAVASVKSGADAAKGAFDSKVAPRANEAAEAAADAAHQARDKGAEFAHQAREKGAEFAHQAKERATQAQKRAVTGIDHGIDSAVPKGQEAIAGLTPKVDHARDVIVDDILPKISEMLGQVQSVKDEKLAQTVAALGAAPAAVAAAPTPKKKRRGGALVVVGLLAAAGAAVAWYLNSQKKPATDPWATDHHVGGAPGVDSQVRATLADKATATGKPAGTAGAAGTGAAGAGAAGAKETPIADSLSAKSSSSSVADKAKDKFADAKDATKDALDTAKDKVVDAKDAAKDKIAEAKNGADSGHDAPGTPAGHASAPLAGEEIQGASGTGTSGFGTDFSEVREATDQDAEIAATDSHEANRKTDLP